MACIRNLPDKKVREQWVLESPNKVRVGIDRTKLQDYLAQPEVKNYHIGLFNKVYEVNQDQKSSTNTILPILSDRERFQDEVNDYFKLALDNNMIPTIASLALYLGLTYKKMYELKEDYNCIVRDIIERAIQQTHAIMETAALNGTIPERLYTFMARNYYSLNDCNSFKINVLRGGVDKNDSDALTTYQELKNQLIIEGEYSSKE